MAAYITLSQRKEIRKEMKRRLMINEMGEDACDIKRVNGQRKCFRKPNFFVFSPFTKQAYIGGGIDGETSLEIITASLMACEKKMFI